MKTTSLLPAVAAMFGLLAGCTTVVVQPPAPASAVLSTQDASLSAFSSTQAVPSAAVTTSTPSAPASTAGSPDVAPVAGERDEAGAAPSPSAVAPASTLRVSRSFPRVAVLAKAAEGTPPAFAEKVADVVRNTVASRDIRVEPAGSESGADIRFDLVVGAEPYVRDGEWVVYNASVTGHAVVRESLRETNRDASDRFVGSTTVEGRGVRSLGDKEALGAAATAVAPRTADWAVGVLKPDVCGIAVEIVRIGWSNVDPSRKPALISKAVAQVSSLAGVRDCRVVKDAQCGPLEAVLQVVYVAGAFPEGLDNALPTAFPVLGL